MPEQWINGEKPKEAEEEAILIVGPDDYEEEGHVRIILDEITLRMEAVRIILTSEGNCGVFRPVGFNYSGISKFAYEWACKNFWPMELQNPGWWGLSPKEARKPAKRCGRRREAYLKAILAKLKNHRQKRRHCVVFWNEDQEDFADLIEQARDLVPMKNFHVIRVI